MRSNYFDTIEINVGVKMTAALIDTDALHELIENEVENDQFSGVVLIARDNIPVFKRAYGFASKRYNIPNRLNTKFNLGSINKIFTKTSILKLMEQGKLDINDFVGKYLPNFPKDIAENVAIHHLISFTSGLGDYFNEKYWGMIGNLRSVDDFIGLFIEDPLLFKPGTGKQYSNASYVVLGKIIEAISGVNYYDFVREHIFIPAGMNDTDHFELDYPEPNLAIGYTKFNCCPELGGGLRKENTFLIGSKGSPAGGGYSTVDDLLKFDIAVHEHKLLSPKYSEMVFRPISNTEKRDLPGWVIAGGASGVASFMDKSYELITTIIILSNYDPDETENVYKKIREYIHGIV